MKNLLSGSTALKLPSIVLCLCLQTFTWANAQVGLSSAEFPEPSADDLALIEGAIDIHTHLDPDSFGPYSRQAVRALDVLDMAERARDASMRGFVVKQHYDQTAQLAYLAKNLRPLTRIFWMSVSDNPGANIQQFQIQPSHITTSDTPLR